MTTAAGCNPDLLRRLAPQVLAAVVRRYGHFDSAEDAVQEALLAAVDQWPRDGVPADPRAWLITVAARRLTDLLRSELARRRREDTVAQWVLPEQWLAPAADRGVDDSPSASGSGVRSGSGSGVRSDSGSGVRSDSGSGARPGSGPGARAVPAPGDDTLTLLFLCCHPSLSIASQVALTLRAVSGLTTAEIARAFLVPEATMTRRISRAKLRIRASGLPFAMPVAAELGPRLQAVLHALYLVFNEGYVSTSGADLQRADLSAEAIRLVRAVHRLLPGDGEVCGLLALMVLTNARRAARTAPDGSLVPMAEQDRTSWDATAIAEGVALLTATLPRGNPGAYQLQAAIAAIHDEAPSADATDWPQIVALYELLIGLGDNPAVRLNHAVAVAMADGPAAGLTLLGPLEHDERIAGDHRLVAVRAHLLELTGELTEARRLYFLAAKRTASVPQQRYLRARADRLG